MLKTKIKPSLIVTGKDVNLHFILGCKTLFIFGLLSHQMKLMNVMNVKQTQF